MFRIISAFLGMMLTCGFVSGQTHAQHGRKPGKKKIPVGNHVSARKHVAGSNMRRHQQSMSRLVRAHQHGYGRKRSEGSLVHQTANRERTTVPVGDIHEGVRTPADLRLDLRKQKGSLLWPAASTAISTHFGLRKMENGCQYFSRGIVLDVPEGAPIIAVADGTVSQVMDLQGAGMAVLIKHGRYFTVYNNLATACVSKGDEIKAGQELGRMDETGGLEFYVCDDQVNWLDPEKWLTPDR